MDNATLRSATPDDVSFLVRGILAAERLPSNADVTTYERVFGMEREELIGFLRGILAQPTAGHQLAYGSFHILALQGEPVACCAAWVEALNGAPSGKIIAVALSRFLGIQRWKARRGYIQSFMASVPPRSVGQLQLESFFVEPSARGRGMTAQLIEGVLEHSSSLTNRPSAAEISLFRENSAAIRAYQKAGFEIGWSSPPNEALQDLLGSRGFVKMQRSLI